MVGCHHWLDGHQFQQVQGVGDGQGGLACCSPWGRKESDTTELLNWLTLVQYCRLQMTFLWNFGKQCLVVFQHLVRSQMPSNSLSFEGDLFFILTENFEDILYFVFLLETQRGVHVFVVLVVFVIGIQFPIFESDCSTLRNPLLPLIFSSLCFLVCSTIGRFFLLGLILILFLLSYFVLFLALCSGDFFPPSLLGWFFEERVIYGFSCSLFLPFFSCFMF